jgi:hypothetical protein
LHTEDVKMESYDHANRPNGLPRKVSVKGRNGVEVTVVVTEYRGHVWMSIVPPFTWEAIMKPEHVDQLIHVLGLAREESSRRVPVAGARAAHADNGVVREIEGRYVKAIGNESTDMRGNAR